MAEAKGKAAPAMTAEQLDEWYETRRAAEKKAERAGKEPTTGTELLDRIGDLFDEKLAEHDKSLLARIFGDEGEDGGGDDTSRGRPPVEGASGGGLLKGLLGGAA